MALRASSATMREFRSSWRHSLEPMTSLMWIEHRGRSTVAMLVHLVRVLQWRTLKRRHENLRGRNSGM